jgi:hypothetical protein
MTAETVNMPWLVLMNRGMGAASFAMVFGATSLHLAERKGIGALAVH